MVASLLISLTLGFLIDFLRVLERFSDVSYSEMLEVFGSCLFSPRAQRMGLLKRISLETITWILSLKGSFIIVAKLALHHQPDPTIKLFRELFLPYLAKNILIKHLYQRKGTYKRDFIIHIGGSAVLIRAFIQIDFAGISARAMGFWTNN